MDYSPRHNEIKEKLQKIAESVHDIDGFAKSLKTNHIAYEDVTIANGRQLLIFTGSSGYDIVGCSVKCEYGHIIISDM